MMLILRSGCLKTFAAKPKYSLFIKIQFRIMIYDNLFFLIWSIYRFWMMCANWQKWKFSYFYNYQNIVKKKDEKLQVWLVFEYFFKNPETGFRTATSLHIISWSPSSTCIRHYAILKIVNLYKQTLTLIYSHKHINLDGLGLTKALWLAHERSFNTFSIKISYARWNFVRILNYLRLPSEPFCPIMLTLRLFLLALKKLKQGLTSIILKVVLVVVVVVVKEGGEWVRLTFTETLMQNLTCLPFAPH